MSYMPIYMSPGQLKAYEELLKAAYADVPRLDDIVQFELKAPTKCECGAFKASKTPQGAPGHSSWCPWSKPTGGDL